LNLGAIDESSEAAEGGKPNMIVFLPGTRPVQVRALSWQDYQEQTDPEKYPPPERIAIEVDETLVWSKKKTEPDSTADTDEEDAEEQKADDAVDDVDDKGLGFMQW
jgi:hypothetical protein